MNIKRILDEFNLEDNKTIQKLREEIIKYNVDDYFIKIATLILYPQNQSKNILFNVMIATGLTIDKQTNKKSMPYNKFKEITLKFSELHVREMIDNAQFPFVLPLVYDQCYHLFYGNCELPIDNIQKFLDIIRLNEESIPNTYLRKCEKIIKNILRISEKIYKNKVISYENLKTFSKKEDIYFPLKSELDSLKKFVVFSNNSKNSSFLNSISLQHHSLLIDEIFNYQEPKFFLRPFLKTAKGYILLNVTSFPYLMMNLLVSCFNQKTLTFLLKKYNEDYQNEIHFYLQNLGHYEVMDPTISLINTETYVEKIYSNTTKGYLVVTSLFDHSSHYQIKEDSYTIDATFLFHRIRYLKNVLLKSDIEEDKILFFHMPYLFLKPFHYSKDLKIEKNVFIIQPFEIKAIYINEMDESFFLTNYFEARKQIHFMNTDFFELNNIALYSLNHYQFMAPAFFSYIQNGSYSSDYISKTVLKEKMDVLKIPSYGNFKILNLSNEKYYSPDISRYNYVFKVEHFNLWFIFKEKDNEKISSIGELFIECLFFWLKLLKEDLRKYRCNLVFLIEIPDNFLEYSFYNNYFMDPILKYTIKNKKITLYITKELYATFHSKTNYYEKKMMQSFLEMLENVIPNFIWNPKHIEGIEEKALKVVDYEREIYKFFGRDRAFIKISSAHMNILLKMIRDFIEDNRLEGSNEMLNKVIDFLYHYLLTNLKKYSKTSLIEYLYKEYEKLIPAFYGCFEFYKSSCDTKVPIEPILEEYNTISQSINALDFLIELLSSFNTSGSKNFDAYDIDAFMGIATLIIEYAGYNDLYYYKLTDGKLKVDGYFMPEVDWKVIRLVNAGFRKIRYQTFNNDLEKISVAHLLTEEKLNEIFLEEYGYTFDDFKYVTHYLIHYDNLKNINSLNIVNINDLTKKIVQNVPKEIFYKILYNLTLFPREDFLKPPKNYQKYDVYPWRFNRELSFSRKPIIMDQDNLIWGIRTLANSVNFYFSLMTSGILKAKGRKMLNLMSTINQQRGKEFNDLVYQKVKSIEGIMAFKNVSKVNKKRICDANGNPLGDIDIFYIAKEKGIIGLIETKNYNLANNIYEIHLEYERMFIDGAKNSFLTKEKRRVEWINKHLLDVEKQYHLEKKKWKIKYMFVVNGLFISSSLYKGNVKIISASDLQERDLLEGA